MPSSTGYTRNYKQEMKTATTRGEDKGRALRNKARRAAISTGKATKGDGKEIDHKKPLRSGGSGSLSNTRVRSKSANRSDNGHKPKKR